MTRLDAYLCWSDDGDASISPHDDRIIESGRTTRRAEYLVLTDEEAQQRCAEYIADSLWAFRPKFLEGLTGLDADVFALLASKCEDANPAVLSIVNATCGLPRVVADAINSDGRGHFLASYDGEENESGAYFIYRTN